MLKQIGCTLTVAVIMAAGFALAVEDLGVKIYPGAKKDEQWTQTQIQMMKMTGGGTGACYRTKDPVARVADFYLKNGFKLSFGQVTPEGAMLQMGDKVSMNIQNMKKVDNTDDTKICFGKK